MKARPLSLKGRALAWLAQREHSRAELRDKLLRHLARFAARQAAEAAVGGDDEPAASAGDGPEAVDALLDWLQQHRYLSDQRFVESRVHARSARYGNVRIQHELRRLGVSTDAVTQQQLRDSEFGRAREVWQRKFGDQPPPDAAARAKQMRFLAARGFSAEVIRRVVKIDVDDG